MRRAGRLDRWSVWRRVVGAPLRYLVVVGLLGAVTACQATAPVAVDPLSAPLLAEHSIRATGATRIVPIEVGDPMEQPWSLYLEASRAIGLDFTPDVGATAELRRTPIAADAADAADAAVFVLVRDGRVIGAWLAPGGTSSGVVALSGSG